MVPPIFVTDTKIIYGYNLVAPLRSNVECHGRKSSSIYLLNNSSINLQLSSEKYFDTTTGNKTICIYKDKLNDKISEHVKTHSLAHS